VAQAEEPDSYDDELARIDASIADLKIRDMAAAKERTQIAAKIQAAQFQRDILAHANQQKARKSRRVRRRPPIPDPPPTADPPPHGALPPTADRPPRGQTPREQTPGEQAPGEQAPGEHTPRERTPRERTPRERTPRGQMRPGDARPSWSEPGTPRTGPPGVATDGVTLLVDDPPAGERPAPAPRRPQDVPHEPEASSQSVQNILLGLGALLLGVAAVVFAGVAVSNPLARATILAVATAIALSVAPGIARRGLTSTAETVAAVGLVLLPMTIFALHGSALVGGRAVPAPPYLGVTFAITAVASFLYAGVTRLVTPRCATVIALQPVPPLLAQPFIESPAGWGLALTVTAVLDLLLLTTVIRRGPLVPRWPWGRPGPADRESVAEADARDIGAADFAARDAGPDPADPAAYGPAAPARPETRPEEPDLIIESLTGNRRSRWRPSRIFPGPRPAGAPAAGSVPLAPPATPPSADWLRELTFALLCAAVAGALL
jgi:hypothetical protein